MRQDFFYITYTRKCKGCGRLFKRRVRSTTRARKEYCSDKCQEKHTPKRTPLETSLRKHIFSRDGDQCRYCGERAECIDHVMPVSHGGNNAKSNLVACCTTCNLTVMDRAFDNFKAKREWILKARKIAIIRIEREEYKRPFWHRFVYGGLHR